MQDPEHEGSCKVFRSGSLVGGAVADLSSFPVVICSICEKRVNVETSKTDEDGQAVH